MVCYIDTADQLSSSNAGRRRIKRGAWQALDQWLLTVVFVNCYLLSRYSDIDGKREVNFRSQADFRNQIIQALLVIGKDAPGIRKHVFSHTNKDHLAVPLY